ncbi:MAG TPA: aromatic-ring-hydroxylating dioxygenase subunit beta, partial [Chloroflexota bacterium]|nr:aromatic-ring-hydroxylating dioxygenase subunit beta [Chloroflexota bacterium]
QPLGANDGCGMTGTAVDATLQFEIEQFLYDEAALLDEGRFWEWLELFTEDVRYWMPVREILQGRPDGLHPDDQPAVPLMDDDLNFLRMRIKRLDTGLAHSETPPSRTRHLIANVRVRDAEAGELDVLSNFHVYQGRTESIEYNFYGRREDRLRRVGGAWKIAQRKIVLDQTVLTRALSTFF